MHCLPLPHLQSQLSFPHLVRAYSEAALVYYEYFEPFPDATFTIVLTGTNIPLSVAMVMTNVFRKNGIMVSGKLAKIVRIFVDIGHIKNRGVIYWPERIRPVIPTL